MEKKVQEVNTFDELSSRLLGDSLDSLLRSPDDISSDGLIWIDFLKNAKVRSVLSAAVGRFPKIEVEEICSKELLGETGLSAGQVYHVLTFSAISALQLYVVDNFLCFVNSSDDFSAYDDCLQFVANLFLNEPLIEYTLNCDGELLHSVARRSALLKLARFLFTNLLKSTQSNGTPIEQLHLLEWSLRAAVVHQISLKSVTSSLYEEILSYINRIAPFIIEEEAPRAVESDATRPLQMNSQFKLNILNEIISAVLIFGEIEHSKKYFSIAQNLSHLKFNLTGCLGTRTLYQSKPVSQLMVQVEKDDDGQWLEEGKEALRVNLPKNEKLEDDTLLQDVKFVSTSPSGDNLPRDQIRLTESEQCFLTAAIKYTNRFGDSSDNLLHEELLAYIYFLLEKTNVWSISFTLLELRSLFERSNRRRVERSMKQIETLANTVRSSYEKKFLFSEALGRIHYFYSVLPSPFWIVEKHLGDLLASLGVIKSALDVYLRLEMWTEVIACYRQLSRPDKAEEIVRKKLEQDGDQQPDLHCLLGEITGDIACYSYSWEISGQRYARAPKMLGMHYFALQEFDRALEYFQQSVAVNSMQMDAWYRIGYITLLQQNWEQAAKAYRRVLQFDEDSFEAWNNLSKAYIKLGDKQRAMRTLQEAIKCNFEEWKLWDNYIAVAADVGAFNEVIEAWNRLIELKGKYVDDKISEILVQAIMEDVRDYEGEPASRYMAKALKLFGRVTATCDGSAAFWRHYAKLMLHNKEAETSRITQCLQKCHRKMLAIPNWDKDLGQVTEMALHCTRLADEYLAVAEFDPANQATILNGGKLTLNSALVLLNRAKGDLALVPANEGKLVDLEALVTSLEEKLEVIKQRLAQ